MKQTAVEWLVEQLKDYDFTPPSNNEEYVIVMPKWIFNAKIEQAKEMEKQQIKDAFDIWFKPSEFEDGEQYYNEKFKKDKL